MGSADWLYNVPVSLGNSRVWACPQYITLYTLCCAKVEKLGLGLGLVSWLGLVVNIGYLKPNSITLAGSELAPNMFEAGSELVRSQLRTSWRNGIWLLRYWLLSLYSGLCRTPHRASVNSENAKEQGRTRFQVPMCIEQTDNVL